MKQDSSAHLGEGFLVGRTRLLPGAGVSPAQALSPEAGSMGGTNEARWGLRHGRLHGQLVTWQNGSVVMETCLTRKVDMGGGVVS